MRANFRVETNPRIRTLGEMFKLDQKDMDAILLVVDSRFRKNERTLFATEGSSGGEKWPPLKRKRSPKRFAGKKIMQRTGRLRRSLQAMFRLPSARIPAVRSASLPLCVVSMGSKSPMGAFR